MRRRVLIYAAAVLFATTAAHAGVRVEADEVIFTLRAPEAREVYLVGDFNQWNPTVEPMLREGDAFVVRLFLVAGTYRYKFVVDGRTMADPDNRGPSPERGSPIVLVERSGGLILSTEIRDEPRPVRTAQYHARYLGFLRDDGDDTDVEQHVDVGLRAALERLRARAIVATGDSSWTWSPARVDATFDRGFVEVQAGAFALRGFENDSTWASSDPMGLVGGAGLYRYDAGLGYHGVTAVAASKHAALRARWADETARGGVARARIDPAATAAFAAGSASDTTAYAYTPSFNGSDVLALEAAVSTRDFGVGYAFRDDSGVNPGVWVDVTRAPPGFATRVHATREERRVSAAWTEVHLGAATVQVGYGWGEAEARAYAAAVDTSDLSAPIDAAPAASRADVTRRILESDRWVVEAARGSAALRWDRTAFDFDGLEGRAEAEVQRVVASARAQRVGVDWSARVAHTRQRYRDTPDALYIDWPERNLWLSRWDAVDVPSMVGIGVADHTVWSLDAARAGARARVFAAVLLQTLDVVDDPVHASVRAGADVALRGPWYAYADARGAWYDRAEWGATEAFGSVYLEAGYRSDMVRISAGFGLDPWAFDPVVGDFADLGRSEFLRAALAGGVRRSGAADIGRALVARERALEDLRLFKLECVIELR